jgi:gluconolactonase
MQKSDQAFDDIVPAGAKLTQIATGFTWTEGPIWTKSGVLLFADIPSNTIRRWTSGEGVTIFIQPSGYTDPEPYRGIEPGSNGMTLDNSGRLTVAGHARRNVWRLETLDPKGQITVLADRYQGKKLNSPNDLVYKSDGALYFTDPPYGLETQSDKDPKKELQVNGVYRIPGARDMKPGASPANAKLQLLVKDLPRPNGIAFSPDEKILYVSNSEPKFWMRYTVKHDGSVGEGKMFFDAKAEQAPGSPDGIKVDQKGNLYGAGPGGVWIFSPDGKHLGTIPCTEKVANVAFAGDDNRTLYVTASTSVYTINLKIAGIRP